MQNFSSTSGFIIIISAPSGGGKSSLARALLKNDKNLRLSISTTTRSPRPGELDGQNYRFTMTAEFNQLIKAGVFLEYAQVYGNYYGTSLKEVNEFLELGFDILFDIDWQGARSIKQQMKNVVTIFILPPNTKILEERIRERNQDSSEVINNRMEGAVIDMAHASEYDYVVVNGNFDKTLDQLMCIIRAERLRTSRLQNGVQGIV